MAIDRLQGLLQRAQSAGDIAINDRGNLVSDGKATISAAEARSIVAELERDGFTAAEQGLIKALLAKPAVFADSAARQLLEPFANRETVSVYRDRLAQAGRDVHLFAPDASPKQYTQREPAEVTRAAAALLSEAEQIAAAPDASAAEKAEANRIIATIASSATIMGADLTQAAGVSANQLAAKGANALRAYIQQIGGDGLSEADLGKVHDLVLNDRVVDPGEHVVIRQILGRTDTPAKSIKLAALEALAKRPSTNPEDLKSLAAAAHIVNVDLAWTGGAPQERAAHFWNAVGILNPLVRGGALDVAVLAMDALDTANMKIAYDAATLDELGMTQDQALGWRQTYLTWLVEKAPPTHPEMGTWHEQLFGVARDRGDVDLMAKVLTRWEGSLNRAPSLRDYLDIYERLSADNEALIGRVHGQLSRLIRRKPDAMSRYEYLRLAQADAKLAAAGDKAAEQRARDLLEFFNGQPEAVRRGRPVTFEQVSAPGFRPYIG